MNPNEWRQRRTLSTRRSLALSLACSSLLIHFDTTTHSDSTLQSHRRAREGNYIVTIIGSTRKDKTHFHTLLLHRSRHFKVQFRVSSINQLNNSNERVNESAWASACDAGDTHTCTHTLSRVDTPHTIDARTLPAPSSQHTNSTSIFVLNLEIAVVSPCDDHEHHHHYSYSVSPCDGTYHRLISTEALAPPRCHLLRPFRLLSA